MPRNAGSVTVFRTPSASAVPEVVSPGVIKDDLFSSPHKDNSEAFFDAPKFQPIEIKVHLSDADNEHVELAREKFSEVFDELIDTEKNYVNALGNVQVYTECSIVLF